MRQSNRLTLIKAIVGEIGLKGLAEVEAHAVRNRHVPERLISRLELGATWPQLTPRQREIMVLLTSGMSQQEIADSLGIHRETVKKHLKMIYLRLGVHNKVEAINAFIENAL